MEGGVWIDGERKNAKVYDIGEDIGQDISQFTRTPQYFPLDNRRAFQFDGSIYIYSNSSTSSDGVYWIGFVRPLTWPDYSTFTFSAGKVDSSMSWLPLVHKTSTRDVFPLYSRYSGQTYITVHNRKYSNQTYDFQFSYTYDNVFFMKDYVISMARDGSGASNPTIYKRAYWNTGTGSDIVIGSIPYDIRRYIGASDTTIYIYVYATKTIYGFNVVTGSSTTLSLPSGVADIYPICRIGDEQHFVVQVSSGYSDKYSTFNLKTGQFTYRYSYATSSTVTLDGLRFVGYTSRFIYATTTNNSKLVTFDRNTCQYTITDPIVASANSITLNDTTVSPYFIDVGETKTEAIITNGVKFNLEYGSLTYHPKVGIPFYDYCVYSLEQSPRSTTFVMPIINLTSEKIYTYILLATNHFAITRPKSKKIIELTD